MYGRFLDRWRCVPAKCIHDVRPRQQPRWFRDSCVTAFITITFIPCDNPRMRASIKFVQSSFSHTRKLGVMIALILCQHVSTLPTYSTRKLLSNGLLPAPLAHLSIPSATTPRECDETRPSYPIGMCLVVLHIKQTSHFW